MAANPPGMVFFGGVMWPGGLLERGHGWSVFKGTGGVAWIGKRGSQGGLAPHHPLSKQ